MGLTHSDVLVNADALCEIDIHTRKITRKSKKSEFQQYDHNSERIGFTMERMNDGHDMSQCDRVAIKYLNVRQDDMYIVDDVSVSDDGKHVTFTWLVSANATQEIGSLIFNINFRCWNDEGDITYNWSTHPCSTYSILKGVPSMDSNPKEQYDFWARYKGLVDTVTENVDSVEERVVKINSDAQKAEIKLDDINADLNQAETRSNDLLLICDDLGHDIIEKREQINVLESKTSILGRDIPDLESRVETLERTLDDDPILAVNQEVSNIKTTLANQGRIVLNIVPGTSYSGNITTEEATASTRLITPDMIDCSVGIYVVNKMSFDYRFGVIYYEEDKSWSHADPGWMNYGEYSLRDYGYARFNFSKRDDSELTETDIAYIQANFEIYRTDLKFADDFEFDDLKKLVDFVVEHYDYHDYELLPTGTISAGQISVGSPARCCTKSHIRVKPGMRIRFKTTDYDYGVACFDENKVYDGIDRGWTKNEFYIDFDGYILMNFRIPTNDYLTETDYANIKEVCYIENYVKYSDWFEEDIDNKIDWFIDPVKENILLDQAISSISVEYGRIDGASYVYCRIPKTLNDGRNIIPKVKLTSVDGSLTGGKRSTLTYARANNSVFTINAGLFDVSAYVPVGQTIIDGVSVTNTPMADDNGVPISDTECYPLCIDVNGTLSAPYPRSVDTGTMLNDGITQAITGWGKLVDNFKITVEDIAAEIVHQGTYIRQSIGQYQNGDYAVCTVDQSRGNVKNEAGLTYEALAQIFVDHGVKFAYSLDGGGSAETVIGKRQLNPIYEGNAGRAVPTVISFEVVE